MRKKINIILISLCVMLFMLILFLSITCYNNKVRLERTERNVRQELKKVDGNYKIIKDKKGITVIRED